MVWDNGGALPILWEASFCPHSVGEFQEILFGKWEEVISTLHYRSSLLHLTSLHRVVEGNLRVLSWWSQGLQFGLGSHPKLYLEGFHVDS